MATPPPPAPPDPNAALTAQAARLNAEAAVATAEAARINAEAARDRASVQAMGLPSYAGTTTLHQNAGAIEALILATDAVEGAAARICKAARGIKHPPGRDYEGRFLIVAGDDTLDFGLAASFDAQIEAFEAIFKAAAPTKAAPTKAGPAMSLLGAGLAAPVAALTAIAGLLRTDTEITAVDHSAAISHRVLATAVAGELGRRATLPGAAVGGSTKSPLIARLMKLAGRRDAVAAAAAALPAEKGERLKAAVLRFDTFFAGAMAPDAAGRVPLVQAARLEAIFSAAPLVLRIHVEKAGGSLIKLANIRTFFGGDPVRVSGGLVASYVITDPADGQVIAAKVLSCRTAIGTLKDIQAGRVVGVPR